MAVYLSKTIGSLVNDINNGSIVLPALQRDFVWSEDKICALFDSIIRGYPIGTFLFWKIDKEEAEKYVLNSFISTYDERELPRGQRITVTRDEYTAVLDGQQRITSLYIGLMGKIHVRLKGKPKKDDKSYVDKYLCVNVLQSMEENEDISLFDFKELEMVKKVFLLDSGKKECWIPISEANDKDFYPDTLIDLLQENAIENGIDFEPIDRQTARKVLQKLNNSLVTIENVNYYNATDATLADVVEMFVRVNSGGQNLSASDLMLSVAAGEVGDEDIHLLINDAIDQIAAASSSAETGFSADKELILTAGLLFTEAKNLSLRKKENYTREQINKVLDRWDSIIDALCAASSYIESLGILGGKLTSKNIILPIAYYFYKNNLNDNHYKSQSLQANKDRIFIRQWVLRAMINSIFSDGINTTLIQIRNIMDASQEDCFPLKDLMEYSKRPLNIGDEKIEEILGYKYGDVRVKPLLIELTQYNPDYNVEVDHIWPQKFMSSKKELKRLMPTAPESKKNEYKKNYQFLPNLQLLIDAHNNNKGTITYDKWLNEKHPDKNDHYYEANCIPKDGPYDFGSFLEFCQKRQELLRLAIADALPKDFEAIVNKYHLNTSV